MIVSTSAGSAAARSAGVGILREQRRASPCSRARRCTAPTGSSPRAARTRSCDRARTSRRDTARAAARATAAARAFAPRGRATAVTVPSSRGRTVRRRGDAGALRRRSARAVARIDAAARAADGHPALGDAVWLDLEHPAPDSAGFLVDDHAYAHIARSDNAAPRHWTLGLAVAPAARDDGTAARARRRGRARTSPRTAAGASCSGCSAPAPTTTTPTSRPPGMRPARDLYEMRVAAPARRASPKWPAGVARAHRSSPAATKPRGSTSTTARSPATPSRAAGPRRRWPAASPSRGSIRRCSCSRSTPTGSPASTG